MIRYRPRGSAFLAAGLAGLLFYLLFVVFGPTGMQRIQQLEQELADQRNENERLAQHNEELKREILRIAEDPQHRQAQARFHFGLIGKDEVFVQQAE